MALPFIIPGLSAANYTFVVADANNCSQTITINLSEPNTLTVGLTGNTSVCEGDPSNLGTNVNGGTQGYSYLWLPGGSTTSNISVIPSVPTTYTVQITDLNGCVAITTLAFNVVPKPVISIVNQNALGCEPLCTTVTLSQAQNPNYIYSWNFVNTTTGANFTSSMYNGNVCLSTPGNYSLNLTVSASSGCFVSANYASIATVHPGPVADFNHSPIKPILNIDQYVTFTDASYGATIVSWNWYFMNTAQYTSIEQNPFFEYTEPGTYPVVLVVTTDKGCKDTLIRPLVVGEDFGIYVPNAFTPNNDGFNDVFQPKGFGIVKYEITIFDRWGEVVFKTKSFEEGWDGRYQGRGNQIVKEDVYTWLINCTSVFGKSHELKGHVTLIR